MCPVITLNRQILGKHALQGDQRELTPCIWARLSEPHAHKRYCMRMYSANETYIYPRVDSKSRDGPNMPYM